MRLFKPNIDKLKAKRDVEGLIRAFQDKDIDVRKDAAKALGDLGDERAVEALTENLLKPLTKSLSKLGISFDYTGAELMRDVIEALGKIGSPRAVEALIKHGSGDAIKALGKIGNKRAIEFLIKALESRDGPRRGAAAVAFEEIWSKYPEKMEETIPRLMSLLESEDRQIRLSAADVIGIISRTKPEMVEEAAPQLISLLREKIRGDIIYTLGRIGAVEALEILKKLVNEKELCDGCDSEGNLRTTTIGELAREAVERINKKIEKNPGLLSEYKNFWKVRELVDARETGELIELYCHGVDIVPEIIRLFNDWNELIRRDAAYIFGEIGERYPEEVKDGISKLVALLDDEKEVRDEVFKSLVMIGMKRPDIIVGAIPALVKYKGFFDIAKSLRGFPSGESDNAKESISGLISLLYDRKEDVRKIAAFTLGVIGEKQPELVKNTIPPLIKLLKEEESVRSVSFAMGAIGKNRPEWIKNAIPKLVEILKKRTKNREVEAIIARAFGKIGRNRPEMVKEAIPKLISLLRYGKSKYYGDIEVSVSATEALIRIGEFGEKSSKIISKIIDYLLSEGDVYAREKASLSLGILKEYPETKEAIPLLVESLDDACWRVRGAAAFAIGEIGEVVSDPKSLSSLLDAIPLLIRLLDDEKAWVRLSAASALGELGGVEALEELKKLENDKGGCKTWYLGEERVFVVKEIVREAVEKIEARIEGREIKPELKVSLSKTKLKKQVQSVELFVENKGKVSARDIEIVFPDVVIVEGLRKFSLRAGEGRKLALEVEPKKVGRISLALKISFNDFKGNEYRSTEKFWIEVEEAIIPTKREVMEEKEVILERAIYDPCKRDFIEGQLPRMKEWINHYDRGAYWFAISIQNNTDKEINDWGVELETSAALKIKEAKIEGIEIEIPHEAYLGLFKISVPKEYGIVIPKEGTQRVYFKLRAEKPKTTYKISGVFKSAITGDVPIRAKEFKYLCDVNTIKIAIKENVNLANDYVSSQLWDKYPQKEDLVKLTESFRIVLTMDRMCNQDTKTEEYLDKLSVLKNYTEGFSENFTKQVDEFSRFMEQEQLGYLDDKYKGKVRRLCTNLVDVWISEFLKG